MNYANTTIVERPSYTDRANATSGTKEDGSSHLEPWHYSVRHNKQDYWTADDTKDLSSTFDYGYYYPETPVKYRQRKDEGLMRKHAIEQVNKLYAPPNVLEKMYLPPGEKGDPIRDLEWRAFVHIKSFAVSGTWGIHLFFGDPPDSSSDWFLADNRVGTVNVLSNSNIGACPNCKKQQEDGQLITGIVLLSNELQIKDRNVPVMDRAAVVEYLKKNLTWRIAKDAREVPIKDDMGLVVGVAAREVVYPLEPTKLPLWNKAEYFPDATRGKPGGFDGILVEVTS